MIPAKVTKDTQGVAVMALKKKHLLVSARIYDGGFADPKRYMLRTLPGAGALPKDGDATRTAHPGIAGRPQKEPEI